MGQVGIALGGDLSGDNRHARGHQRFAGHMRVRVLRQQRVQHGVGDLVGYLVGVAFGHGFGGEEIFALVQLHGVSHGLNVVQRAAAPWHASLYSDIKV